MLTQKMSSKHDFQLMEPNISREVDILDNQSTADTTLTNGEAPVKIV